MGIVAIHAVRFPGAVFRSDRSGSVNLDIWGRAETEGIGLGVGCLGLAINWIGKIVGVGVTALALKFQVTLEIIQIVAFAAQEY